MCARLLRISCIPLLRTATYHTINRKHHEELSVHRAWVWRRCTFSCLVGSWSLHGWRWSEKVVPMDSRAAWHRSNGRRKTWFKAYVENCSNTSRIVEFSYNCCCLLDYQIEVSRGIDGGWRSSQRMVDSDLQIRAFLSVRASVLV